MPNVFANGIQIEYETFGEPSSPSLLLIAGIGGQMIGWDEELCKEWARKGLYVIRFDNRDVGLSTKMEEAGVHWLVGNACLFHFRQDKPTSRLSKRIT